MEGYTDAEAKIIGKYLDIFTSTVIPWAEIGLRLTDCDPAAIKQLENRGDLYSLPIGDGAVTYRLNDIEPVMQLAREQKLV